MSALILVVTAATTIINRKIDNNNKSKDKTNNTNNNNNKNTRTYTFCIIIDYVGFGWCYATCHCQLISEGNE
jgi:hypothetical protein